MTSKKHLILAITACTLLLAPVAQAEGVVSADGQKASASLDFRIVIPPVLRLVENQHPSVLPAADASTGQVAVEQRVELVSTLRKGFCMDLKLNQPVAADWQLKTRADSGMWVESTPNGHRLCANRAGRFQVSLAHAFSLKDSTQNIRWPVYMNLAAL